ncbi:MAG: hypothetical protein H7259_02710 [Cytophagales bacterium]|nr:hypothetical protein [Cytophaga sp.]
MSFNASSIEEHHVYDKEYAEISNYIYVVIFTIVVTALLFLLFQFWLLFTQKLPIAVWQWMSLSITIIISIIILIGFFMAGVNSGGGMIG